MSQTRRQTEPLRNTIPTPWGNVPSVTCGMMLLDPMGYKSNLCMKQHQLRGGLEVAQRFFWHCGGLSTQPNRSCSLQSLREECCCYASRGLDSPDPLSSMHVGGMREPIPLPGGAQSTPREQEWISCPTAPCMCHGVKIFCPSARSLATSLHRQPLINFHRI